MAEASANRLHYDWHILGFSAMVLLGEGSKYEGGGEAKKTCFEDLQKVNTLVEYPFSFLAGCSSGDPLICRWVI